MWHPHVVACRKILDLEESGVQPLLVRVFGGEFGLDLLVFDDAALRGVDQEHSAGLQTHLLDDGRRVQVQHAGLRRHHHQTVLGHLDA